MTFDEMMVHLKRGKNVRRKTWGAGEYIYAENLFTLTNNDSEFSFGINDFESDDWELFEDTKMESTQDLHTLIKYLEVRIAALECTNTKIIRKDFCNHCNDWSQNCKHL